MTPAPSLSNNREARNFLPPQLLSHKGFSLLEVLIALTIMATVSAFMFPALIQFQDQGVREISKNDLADRAQRLSIYLSRELGMAGFMLGRRPEPSITVNTTNYDATILVNNSNNADDEITILKAESFFPKVVAFENVASGGTNIKIEIPRDEFQTSNGNLISSADDRRAHLGLQADTSYNNIAFENHKRGYPLLNDADKGVQFTGITAAVVQATIKLKAGDDLREDISEGSEILKVRAKRFYVATSGGESQLLIDDLSAPPATILDRSVDGFQVRYLIDGTWEDNPAHAEDIRVIRFYLLVRSLNPQKGLTNTTDYSSQMGPKTGSNIPAGTYGPYNDAFRRLVITEDVEVKNYVAR